VTPRHLPRLLRYWLEGKRRGKQVHFMACADESNRLLRRIGLPGDLVNASSYINEHKFCIGDQDKRYDAVYAAQMQKFKRLHLAALVRSLFVVTYGDCLTADGAFDLPTFEPAIQHSDYNRGWISQEEVIAVYNSARVGLALSACEGTMLAAVEYMLCGLPLLSTPCRGGREQFFDDRYVKVVDPTATAVAEGLRDLIERRIDPELVRAETLKKLQVHRERFCDYIIRIIKSRSGEPPPRARLLHELYGDEDGTRSRFVLLRDFRQHGFE
jgi:glycosyltransferase involved in cell wall biosynthesis